ncbi:C16orf70 [Cordylochernes scorpioides]|uniref:C16orf70 n=1 Tax=Cordylochernes scorpioides TaxID=51811 RepID=A0ABY6JZ86_9ARAC|nr:C16orf70 [Cordylochernes scorpioides]
MGLSTGWDGAEARDEMGRPQDEMVLTTVASLSVPLKYRPLLSRLTTPLELPTLECMTPPTKCLYSTSEGCVSTSQWSHYHRSVHSAHHSVSDLSLSPCPQQQNAQGLGGLQFPNGASPIVSKMCIYSGNNIQETRPPPLPLSSFYNHCYLDKLDVIREKGRTRGVRLHLITEVLYILSTLWCDRGDVYVQRVLGLIGSPSKVFYKAEDKMKIHSPNAHKLVTAPSSDYFYNYFTLGMDILFDCRSHTVQKFILHTNFPGHFNFNMYYRCNFSINLRPQVERCLLLPPPSGALVDISSDQEQQVITAFTKIIDYKHKAVEVFSTPSVVLTATVVLQWDSVQDRLIQPSERPVVLNRASSTNTTNPFGSTFSFGVEDIIFEVQWHLLLLMTLCLHPYIQ